METIVKKLLLAAAFASALTASAIAQTYDPSPRDPAFGKGNADNDTFHRPREAEWARSGSWGMTYGSMSSYGSTSYGEASKGARRLDRR